MSSNEVFDSKPFNRRQFVKIAGGATLSLSALLAACGGSNTSNYTLTLTGAGSGDLGSNASLNRNDLAAEVLSSSY